MTLGKFAKIRQMIRLVVILQRLPVVSVISILVLFLIIVTSGAVFATLSESVMRRQMEIGPKICYNFA